MDIYYLDLPVQIKRYKDGYEEQTTATINMISNGNTPKELFLLAREKVKQDMFNLGYTSCSVTFSGKTNPGTIKIYTLIISEKNGENFLTGFELNSELRRLTDEDFLIGIRDLNIKYMEDKEHTNIKVYFCKKETYDKYVPENTEIETSIKFDADKINIEERDDHNE